MGSCSLCLLGICLHALVSSLDAVRGRSCLVLCLSSCVWGAVTRADNADLVHGSTAAAMDPKYHRVLASKLQEHANNYQLTDVGFR